MFSSVIAISVGAMLGALLRWALGNALNALAPSLPPGTLAANLVGGYVIGLAISFFGSHPAIAPQWRLFVVTGFCGGLTTFSTFSAEAVALLQQARLGVLALHIGTHVVGSLVMTLLGIATVSALRAA
ncbi:fluoride efflux transporter CrcB [Achromobacter sp. Marseille-Q4962]|uniref:fluoride efflux transporter CrcB n=1 Tax=Achromobacter sp. Marseille-Q4962 TaxID=2942202 RepID=UPI002073BB26|nr:fluoride efflux transporter CrcB [Achromobacter sp. Marseille-Q4962]